MARNSQTSDSKSKCCKDIVKQQALFSQRCQPMLSKHPQCNELCLDFSKRMSNSIKLSIQIQKVQAISLKKSKLLIESIPSQSSFEEGNDNLNQQRQLSKFIKKRKKNNLSSKLRAKKIDLGIITIKLQKFYNFCNSLYQYFLGKIKQYQTQNYKIKSINLDNEISKEMVDRIRFILIEQNIIQCKVFFGCILKLIPLLIFSLAQFRQIYINQTQDTEFHPQNHCSFFIKLEKKKK